MEQPSRRKKQRIREAQQRLVAQTAAAVVGMDAGKFRHSLVVRPRGGVDSRPFTFSTTREGYDDALAFILHHAGGAPAGEVLVGIEFAGVYGYTLAHYLHRHGFPVVSVLPADSKAWKTVKHRQRLKTDEKDAATITALAAQGDYVSFPFLQPIYAELRHLVSARERLSVMRNASLSRTKATQQILFPEFERIFKDFQKPTARALMKAFPGPEEVLSAPKSKVINLIRRMSRGQMGEQTYEQLHAAATASLALPGEMISLKAELHLLLEQVAFYTQQIKIVEARMENTLRDLPEAQCLLTIPGVAPVTAAVFLGCLGDPRAYSSSRQVLRLAGMSLVEDSSGARRGVVHLSKHGRPLLRRFAFMLGLRAVRAKDGIYHGAFNRMLKRNGAKKLPAIIAVGRDMLCLMFAVARDRRTFTVAPPSRGHGLA
jgi:transposase